MGLSNNSSIRSTLLAAALNAAAASPAAAQDASRITEIYHVFNFETASPRADMIKALTDGLRINVSDSQTITPVVMGEIPETPGKMQLVNLSDNPAFAGIAAIAGSAQSAMFKQVKCDGAVWIASAKREVRRTQQLTLTLCLFPYKTGYHLSIYGIDVLQKGGSISDRLGRAIGTAVVGQPGEWTNKTIIDTVRAVRTKTPTTVTYIEGQPAFTEKPWEDPTHAFPTTSDKATIDTAPTPKP